MTLDLDEVDGITEESCREHGIEPPKSAPPKKNRKEVFKEHMKQKWREAKKEGPYCDECRVRCTVAKAVFWGDKIPVGLLCPTCHKLYPFTDVEVA